MSNLEKIGKATVFSVFQFETNIDKITIIYLKKIKFNYFCPSNKYIKTRLDPIFFLLKCSIFRI